jgi:uncharacterized protein YbaP (TraB family)
MKKQLLSIMAIFILIASLHAQEQTDSIVQKKYQGLLWKITGNNLQKPSYLYGTMHVSKKIAFHLDDVFYKALDEVDAVAVESTPDTWIKYLYQSSSLTAMLQKFGGYNDGFYKEGFKMESPELNVVSQFLSYDTQLMNGLLYRSEQRRADFEEDTYLDMFIYQTGRRFGKETISLEDVRESSYLTERAGITSVKKKPSVWLQKQLEKKNYYTILEDAYRERDLDVLDSINRGGYTDWHNKYMLWERNKNMMNVLDSVMQSGKTVFAGIGAAHLPETNGAIELLRKKGYTVEAYKSEATDVGKTMKEKFETTFKKEPYKLETTPDGFISFKSPFKFTELGIQGNRIYMSPDLANGAYVILTRINTFDILNKEKEFDFASIEKILYESIPGKIISETPIENGDYKGINIVNKTKNGDYQRYNIFLTPIEIIVIKMGGKKEFVLQYGDEVFDSVVIKPTKNKLVKVTALHNEFEVILPDFYTFDNKNRQGKRIIQAIDKTDNSYYFMEEQVLNDVDYIEEDEFEVKQIQRRFYKELKLDIPKGKYTALPQAEYVSKQVFDSIKHDTLHLKTTIQAGRYYLLGYLGKNAEKAQNYFNSFKTKAPIYTEKFETVRDTTLYFSTKTFIKPPDVFRKYYESYEEDGSDKKEYKEFSRKNEYTSPANETISVSMYKFSEYDSYENIDSLFQQTLDYYKNTRTYMLKDKKIGKDKYGNHMINLMLIDTNSNRLIKVKKLVKNGVTYNIKSLLDTINPTSRYVNEFFESFKPADTILGKPLFEDKVPVFMEALKANDSLVFDSYKMIRFNKKHIDVLKNTITNFDFPKDKQDIRTYMIEEMGRIEDIRVEQFLDELYLNSYDNSYAQQAILNAYASRNEVRFVEKIKILLEKDIPLTTESSEINYLFYRFHDSLQLAKKLYPDMLNYTTIQEYNRPIYDLLTVLKDSSLITKKVYKNFRKQILTEAKIELKRQLSSKYTKDDSSYYSSYDSEEIISFMKLLYPFKKDKLIADFLHKVADVQDEEVQVNLLALQAKNGDALNSKLLDTVVKNYKSSASFYERLVKMKKTHLFPKKHATQQNIAKSLLFATSNYDEKKDSLEFVEKRIILIKKIKYEVYFFKTKRNQNAYKKIWKLHLIALKQEENQAVSTDVFFKRNGIEIKETKPLEDQIDDAIERVLWSDRPRVRFD